MSNTVPVPTDLNSAEDFLNAISPVGPYFVTRPQKEVWLFRGQGGDHPLIPSAFRPDGKLARQADRPVTDWQERLLAERDVLARFFDIADRRGLVLPDDSQDLRQMIETLMSAHGDEVGKSGWPETMATPKLLSLAALAQHYGIPTRLLDWSRNALMATYFAAQDALKSLENTGDGNAKMVVWAFYFPLFGKQNAIDIHAPIRVITAPSASNPNLKAQQGVFTMVYPQYSHEQHSVYRPLDEVLKDLEPTGPPYTDRDMIGYYSRLLKFTLPHSQAPSLLRLLGRMDISPSAVFPGYGGVVDDLELQARLRNFP